MKAAKLIFVILTLAILVPAAPAASAGASLFLSPSNGSAYEGETFVVRIFVSASQNVNTFDAYISTSNLTVTGINSGGSICSLYPTQPSKTATTAHFQCGLPTPGYKGSSGYIGSVTVKGNVQGVATMNITSASKVLANDGAGTNVLNSRGSASFTIQPPPTSAPTVTSTTHPKQDSWYKAKTATLNWSSSQGSSFSYSLDRSPSTTPDQVAEAAGNTKNYENMADGIWYFHIRVKGAGGWSSTAHYRLQIDATPPEPFVPEADPKTNAEKRPIIAFSTKDVTSGIDHYEIQIDEGSWDKADNPYKIPSISSGSHKVSVKAVDKAGNERIGTVDISVKEIAAPVILEPKNGSFLPYGTDLLIKGTAVANYKVKIFLDGKEIGTAETDKDGNFSFTYKELIRAGEHKLYAISINPDGIESPHSKEISFTLDPRAFNLFGLTIPGLAAFGGLIFLILILIVTLLFFFFGAAKFRRKIKSVLEELQGKVDKDLVSEKVRPAVKERIDKDFEEAEERVD